MNIILNKNRETSILMSKMKPGDIAVITKCLNTKSPNLYLGEIVHKMQAIPSDNPLYAMLGKNDYFNAISAGLYLVKILEKGDTLTVE